MNLVIHKFQWKWDNSFYVVLNYNSVTELYSFFAISFVAGYFLVQNQRRSNLNSFEKKNRLLAWW